MTLNRARKRDLAAAGGLILVLVVAALAQLAGEHAGRVSAGRASMPLPLDGDGFERSLSRGSHDGPEAAERRGLRGRQGSWLLGGEDAATTRACPAAQRARFAILEAGRSPADRAGKAFAAGMDRAEIRRALRAGPGAPAFDVAVRELRRCGEPALHADRVGRSPQQRQASAPKAIGRKLSPPKLALAPVPRRDGRRAPDCGRRKRMDELKTRIETAPNARIRERAQLVLAAYAVGMGDWQEAERIYAELARGTSDPVVAGTVRRNRQVVRQALSVQMESDPKERSARELELAELHMRLGHGPAARRIGRRLAEEAGDAAVRARALALRDAPSLPSAPIAGKRTVAGPSPAFPGLPQPSISEEDPK